MKIIIDYFFIFIIIKVYFIIGGDGPKRAILENMIEKNNL